MVKRQLLNNTPIALRLSVAFALLLGLLAMVSWFAAVQNERLGASARELAGHALQQVVLAGEAKGAAQSTAADLYALVLLPQRKQRGPIYASLDANKLKLRETLEQLLATSDQRHADPIVDALALTGQQFNDVFQKTADLIEMSGPSPEARTVLIEELMPALQDMVDTLDRLQENQRIQADEHLVAGIAANRREGALRLYGLAALAVCVAAISAWLITRSIARPLAAAVTLSAQVASGNLTAELPVAGRDELGDLIRAMDQMRTDLAKREARIAELAYWDELTGLANRTLFIDRLNVAVSVAGRSRTECSVLLLDLDRFKAVNETLGHPQGDEVLRQVGQRLKEAMPRTSDTVARLGGDEFAIILPTTGIQQAELIAQRLLKTLETPVQVQGQNVDVSASVGLACHSGHVGSAATLLANADMAMYVAKQAGGAGYALFDPAMAGPSQHGLSLLSDLRRAVEEDELYLLYQPKIGLGAGQCHAAEVLVRWAHPQRGMVPPDQFIGFAEKSGFIKTITRWVLDRACRQLGEWHAQGLDVHLNVNISTKDLTQADLPQYIQGLLAQYQVRPRHLCLEVTESGIMTNAEQALASLKALSDMGLDLSIDDFGTGYSSLAYLKRLPVNELKIDRSFVRNLDAEASDATIVRSTIELAHNLGLRVVAEGVETEAVSQRLRDWQCDQAQGYLFSRPIRPEELVTWLKAQPQPEAKVDEAQALAPSHAA